MGKKAFWIMVLMLGGQPLWADAVGGGAAVPSVCGLKGENCGAVGEAQGQPSGASSIYDKGAAAIPAQIRISAENFARKPGAPDKKHDDCKKHLLAAGGCSANDIEVPAPKAEETADSHPRAAQRNAKSSLDKFAQGVKGLEQKATGFMGAIFGLMTRG